MILGLLSPAERAARACGVCVCAGVAAGRRETSRVVVLNADMLGLSMCEELECDCVGERRKVSPMNV